MWTIRLHVRSQHVHSEKEGCRCKSLLDQLVPATIFRLNWWNLLVVSGRFVSILATGWQVHAELFGSRLAYING
jgi:hypothetical protein